MHRFREIMNYINGYLEDLQDSGETPIGDIRLDEMLHSYGTAYFAAVNALERGLNPKLAYVIGLLHDIGRIADGIHDKEHGAQGAVRIGEYLQSSELFSQEEIELICEAVQGHSNKKEKGSDYEECIKDADVLERLFVENERYDHSPTKRKRLEDTLAEQGLQLVEIESTEAAKSDRQVKIGRKYRHFKGKEYHVLQVAKHSETLEEMVVYQALYGENGIWVRPLEMFLGQKVIDGQLVNRFEEIEDME